jgi:D-serine deaminase-like pyridoxal phosphate-dependent protein
MDDLDRLRAATADLDAPFALVDLDALRANADDLVRRAAGRPIRVASKSVRCRRVLEDVLGREGFHGVLAFTLPEALWLHDHGLRDIVVAYPTADRAALRRLGGDADAASHITVMVDDVAHLDLVDRAAGTDRATIRLCLDLDASWRPLGGRVRVGARRSPLHRPQEAADLARAISERRGFSLVGLMAYEAQIAGVGDAPSGGAATRARGTAIRAMQAGSGRELARRRAAVVAAVRAVAPLEFVNGGGTGSLERTAQEHAVTELAAGSGLYGPALFDTYRSFTPRPAALFALPVVRRPAAGVATVLGGGYPASGAPGPDRLPAPHLPAGLSIDKVEGAGEVQTPVLGESADRLRIGDVVFFRHAKAGELCERFGTLHLIEGDGVVEQVPTYRGEGQAFL